VLIDPRLPFTPAFGPASFAAHRLAAGSRTTELHSEEAAFDLDTDEDLERLTGGVVPARLRLFVRLLRRGERQQSPLIEA
jgi:hypothetical protein